MIWISHDLAVVSALADRIAVMYAGRIVESGRSDDVIGEPMHPYTRGLIGSVPGNARRGSRLTQIPGMTPSLLDLPKGCAFRSRCRHSVALCAVDPPLVEPVPGRQVRCVKPLFGEVAQ